MGDKNFWGKDSDIVERLRSVAALKPGSQLPDWLPMQNWGPVFQVVCTEAAEMIVHLRSSIASDDHEIAKWKSRSYILEDKVRRLTDALEELEAEIQSVLHKERE